MNLLEYKHQNDNRNSKCELGNDMMPAAIQGLRLQLKFLKKHKLLSFAVISFLFLTGVNFYMIYELVELFELFGTVLLGTI